MKKKYPLSLALVALTGLSIVFSTGCAKKTEVEAVAAKKPVVIDYKPLFPLGTEIAGVHNLLAESTNAVVQDLNNAITGKLGQVLSAYMEKLPKSIRPNAAFSDDPCEKYRKQLVELTGLKSEDFKWIAYSVANIPTNFPDVDMTMPDMTAVLHTAKPIDPIALTEGIRKLLRESIREHLQEMGAGVVDPVVFESALDKFRRFGAMKKCQWEGRPAVKIILKAPEMTNGIIRLSPILAQVGDGRLLVMASSESALKTIGDLYAGTARAQSMEPVIREVASGNGPTFFALSFPRIDKFIPSYTPNSNDLFDPVAILGQIESLAVVTGTENDDYFLECSAGFKSVETADGLVAQLLMLKSGLGLLASQMVPELSLQTMAMKFIDKITAESEAGTCRIRFAIFPSLVDEINPHALLRLYVDDESLPEVPEEDGTEAETDGETENNGNEEDGTVDQK